MPAQEATIELTQQQQEQIRQATGKTVTTVKFTSNGASASASQSGAGEQDGVLIEC